MICSSVWALQGFKIFSSWIPARISNKWRFKSFGGIRARPKSVSSVPVTLRPRILIRGGDKVIHFFWPSDEGDGDEPASLPEKILLNVFLSVYSKQNFWIVAFRLLGESIYAKMMLERFFRNKNHGTIDLTSLPVKPSRSLFFNSKSNRIMLFHTIHDCQVCPQRLSEELTGFLRDHFMAGTKCDGQHKRLSKGSRLDHPDDLQWRNWRHFLLKMAVAVLVLNLSLALSASLDVAALHTTDISLHLKGTTTTTYHSHGQFKSHHPTPWVQGNWTKLHHGNNPKLVARSSVCWWTSKRTCSTNKLGTIYLYLYTYIWTVCTAFLINFIFAKKKRRLSNVTPAKTLQHLPWAHVSNCCPSSK